MISRYGRPQTTLIGWTGVLGTIAFGVLGAWAAAAGTALAMLALLAFFRDPDRRIPAMRGGVVAPADGKVSSVHELEHFEPLGGPAVCIRIFLSVLNVHVNRAPLYGRVRSIRHKPGEYLNALRPESAERNESLTLTLDHPTHGTPVGAVRQVAGSIARRIVCGAEEGQILQRGQRFGMIKFGSTTEVYLPNPELVRVEVREGQAVQGGATLVAMIRSRQDAAGNDGANPVAGASASGTAEASSSSCASSASSAEASSSQRSAEG